MRYFKKTSGIFLIVLFITSACNTRISNTRITDINFLLDSLELIYAPDKRISLWDLSISESSATISLSGELDKTEAYNVVDEVITNKYPDVENKIELLPEEGNEQIVTGLINNSVANLRSDSRHSSELVTQALLGTPIRVLKRENDWYLVQTPNKYIAWVDYQALVRIDEKELANYKLSKKIVYNLQYGFS